jgi:hypothetical protein
MLGACAEPSSSAAQAAAAADDDDMVIVEEPQLAADAKGKRKRTAANEDIQHANKKLKDSSLQHTDVVILD